jgi:ribonucleoside-triphosphate reductase
MFVKERFNLRESILSKLKEMKPRFGYDGFGEMIFYRTYSRTKFDGGKENWFDVVKRVTEGTFSIRKDWYLKNHITWDEEFWQHYSYHFAVSMFKMEWLPPGRGLWAMGTDYVYDRGSMALYNCAATDIGDDIGADAHWVMDALMNGCGVGFYPIRDNSLLSYRPNGSYDYVIEDSREGWCDSTQALIDAHLEPNQQLPNFIYKLIRKKGSPIRGFGGISSGPEPLMYLHQQIIKFFAMFRDHYWYDSVMLKTDIINAIGCCVVAGNVRRSAELCKGSIDDLTFLDLKNYDKYPHRAEIGWMSNNSVALEDDKDFEKLGALAERVIRNGEPGYMNLRNMKKGRIGKEDGLREDQATLFNPCGEIPLENKETCNIAETLPTNCDNKERWLKACEYATVYCSTVSLLPTHRPETNAIIARNRRIGIGIIDYTGWVDDEGQTQVIKAMREGYQKVRSVNRWVNAEAGVPEAIRVTTVKPGGTTPKLPGKTSGITYPTFAETERRVRINNNAHICQMLKDAGVRNEPDVTQPDSTTVFSFAIKQGPAKPMAKVTLWEQAMNLITVQREWADNAVSNTLYFRPKWQLVKVVPNGYIESYIVGGLNIGGGLESYQDGSTRYERVEEYGEWKLKIYQYDPNHEEDIIEQVLATIAPLTKSVSLLPYSDVGVYPQMPESALTEEEYHNFHKPIIDWSQLRDEDAEIEDDKYCSGGVCVR